MIASHKTGISMSTNSLLAVNTALSTPTKIVKNSPNIDNVDFATYSGVIVSGFFTLARPATAAWKKIEVKAKKPIIRNILNKGGMFLPKKYSMLAMKVIMLTMKAPDALNMPAITVIKLIALLYRIGYI